MFARANPIVRFISIVFLFAVTPLNGSASERWQDRVQPVSNPSDQVNLFTIVGSNTVGAKLAPSMVEAFLSASGFVNVETTPSAGESLKRVSGVWQGKENTFTAFVSVEAKGSSTGFKALDLGKADIAASSRPIKDQEVIALSNLGRMESADNEHIIAIDGLAIIVHPDNPVLKLPLQSIHDIFTGKITTWSKVGGRKGKITLYSRDNKSGTFDTFKRLVLSKAKLSKKAKRFESNDELSASVRKDESAIGFVALPSVAGAKALKISDGVALPLSPSTLTIATEDYPLSRRLYFYSAEPTQRKEVVNEFVKFVQNDDGQAVVNRSGYVSQSLFAVPIDGDQRLEGWSRMNLNIRFMGGSSSLDNKSLQDVQRLADYLAKPGNKGKKITLVGFSNPHSEVNSASISRLRAQNVRWALRDNKVRNKVATLAGRAVSVADPDSLNAERNRRVEVWVK